MRASNPNSHDTLDDTECEGNQSFPKNVLTQNLFYPQKLSRNKKLAKHRSEISFVKARRSQNSFDSARKQSLPFLLHFMDHPARHRSMI